MPPGAVTEFCFSLVYERHNRTYYCCALSKEEMHVWVAKIQHYINCDFPKNKRDADDIIRRSVREKSEQSSSDESAEEDIFQMHKMRLSV